MTVFNAKLSSHRMKTAYSLLVEVAVGVAAGVEMAHHLQFNRPLLLQPRTNEVDAEKKHHEAWPVAKLERQRFVQILCHTTLMELDNVGHERSTRRRRRTR